MQVILDSSFARPGLAPIWGGKKGEFRDWTIFLSAPPPKLYFARATIQPATQAITVQMFVPTKCCMKLIIEFVRHEAETKCFNVAGCAVLLQTVSATT